MRKFYKSSIFTTLSKLLANPVVLKTDRRSIDQGVNNRQISAGQSFKFIACLLIVLLGASLSLNAGSVSVSFDADHSFASPNVNNTDYTNTYVAPDLPDAEVLCSAVATEATTFHLFSHGRPGALLLDGTWRNAPEIAAWLQEQAMSDELTTLHIYGCEFAKGPEGQQAVAFLEATLGLVVAASTNITGKDGDWVLEIGKIKSQISGYKFNLQCVNATDCDGDGVPNGTDLDDDNDGILDAVECDDANNTLLFNFGPSQNIANGVIGPIASGTTNLNGFTTVNGKLVNVVITASNGTAGHLVSDGIDQFALLGSNSGTISFSFFDASTGIPIGMKGFVFNFSDLESQTDPERISSFQYTTNSNITVNYGGGNSWADWFGFNNIPFGSAGSNLVGVTLF